MAKGDAAQEKQEMDKRLPWFEVMCADAPESMYHSEEEGGVSIMVLKDCSSWFWSHDIDGAELEVGLGTCHGAPFHDAPGHGMPCHELRVED